MLQSNEGHVLKLERIPAAATEPKHHSQRVQEPQWKILHDAAKILHIAAKTPCSQINIVLKNRSSKIIHIHNKQLRDTQNEKM